MEQKSEHDINTYQLQCKLIGQRYAGAVLSRIKLGGSTDADINSWIKKKSGFLVYLGAPGVGKTYLCSALLEWVPKKFNTYRYWKERDFLSKLRHVIENKGEYIHAIESIMDDEFVMIDDIGSSGFNDWRSEVLFALIDFRYESRLPTVFTSNLDRKNICEKLGGRAASRLFAKENLVIEILEGQDLRKDGM